MFKKILFALLVVLFSTTLISKEKVFLDYGFLKDISGRIDKACELKAKGKTVKAEKLLKELDQEMTNYLSKLGSFSLSKGCSIVWANGNTSGKLECLPHIEIVWSSFDYSISKKLLEQMENFTEDTNEIVFINGEFKLLYNKIVKNYYNSFKGEPDCSNMYIYAMPVTVVKGQYKKWSLFQGNMIWSEANVKCESIGMRLPTETELLYAPKHIWDKEKINTEEANADIDPLDKEGHYGYWSSINSSPDEEGYAPQKYSVRCIGGKEFQFKK